MIPRSRGPQIETGYWIERRYREVAAVLGEDGTAAIYHHRALDSLRPLRLLLPGDGICDKEQNPHYPSKTAQQYPAEFSQRVLRGATRRPAHCQKRIPHGFLSGLWIALP